MSCSILFVLSLEELLVTEVLEYLEGLLSRDGVRKSKDMRDWGGIVWKICGISKGRGGLFAISE